MLRRLRRLARTSLIRLGVIDSSFRRRRPTDELLAQGLMAESRPAWMAIRSDTVARQRLARRIAQRLGRVALLASVLRSGSTAMQEPLAWAISGGRFDMADLRALARAVSTPGSREAAALVLDTLPFRDLFHLRTALAAKCGSPEDRVLSDALLGYLGESRTMDGLDEVEQILFVSGLIESGRLEAARRVAERWTVPTTAQGQVRTDVINPFIPGAVNDSEELWLVALNSVYRRLGLEPVALAPEGPTPFDRLTAATATSVEDGPLVTVILSCFRPGPELWTGVRSTLAQTWRSLELIVIDDGSGPEFTELLDEVAASDDRVRVLRPAVNRGTYACRNQAIDEARGVYVTMQDSDDWMHPRRIELQMRHLLAHPALVANVSSCFRISEELLFSQEHGFKLKLCEPSLLFHKDRALAAAGYFDAVRKAADGEYRRRLELATGTVVERLEHLPALTLQRTLGTSLSTSDFGENWMHESRLAYRSAYLLWHDEISAGRASARLPRDPASRPFPAPSRIAGAEAGGSVQRLHLGDAVLREIGGPDASDLVRRIGSDLAAGLTVGFTQVWTPAEPPRPPYRLAPTLQRLINSGRVRQVLLDEAVHADVVVVDDAALLQHPPAIASAVTADSVLVRQESSSGHVRSDVEAAAERLFGVRPDWN